MIQVWIDESTLSEKTRKALAKCQEDLDREWSLNPSSVLLNTKWKGKPKARFKEIKRILLDASPGIGLCCYCEHNCAKPIDHIFCKKLFPEWTFWFPNYVMICSNCNDAKGDAFAVFDADGIGIIEFGKGTAAAKPPTKDNVFVDVRRENPMDLFWVNLTTGYLRIRQGLSARDAAKAKYTRNLLEMNHHRGMMSFRHGAVEEYLTLVSKYVGCRDCTSFPGLHLPGSSKPSRIGISFEEARERWMAYWMLQIQEHRFPTIWLEMKRQYKTNPMVFARLYPKIARVLERVPELF